MFKNNLFRLLESQSGQALLIVVLVLVVALTVGLSVTSRSITSLKNSQNQASSQKALSAAEAGVEQAIKSQNQTNLAGSFTQQYNANYQTSIASISGVGQFLVRGDNSSVNEITKGNPVYIWTTNYSASNPWADPWSGTLTIYWGDPGGSCANNTVAALEVSVISGSRTNPTLQRYAYDPCSGRTSQTGFVNSGAITTSPAGAFGLSYEISLPSLTSVFLISVNPLYANTRVGASVGSGDQPLPFQGANITSTGTADNQVQRKVSVFQGFPQIPADLFPYALFSP